MLFDIAQEQNVKIEFKGIDGNVFSHSKVLTASFLTFMENLAKNITEGMRIKKDMQVDIGVAKIIKQQEANQTEVIKEFMEDRYDEYLTAVKGSEEYASNQIYSAILKETNKLTRTLRGERALEDMDIYELRKEAVAKNIRVDKDTTEEEIRVLLRGK